MPDFVLLIDNSPEDGSHLSKGTVFLRASSFTSARAVANAAAQRQPGEVRINLALTLRNSTTPAGLDVVRWLRACPDNKFPILGYAKGSTKRCLDEGLFQQLFAAELKPFHAFVDIDVSGEPPRLAFVASVSQQVASSMAEDLVRSTDGFLRHSFPEALIAAVRLLLGAIRCGAVQIDNGQLTLEKLACLANRAAAREGLDIELFGWYIRTRNIGKTETRENSLQGRRVLLLDDEAERSGWKAVFAEVFGPGFVAVPTVGAALAALEKQVFDLTLVDIRLIDPNSATALDGVSVIQHIRRRYLDLPVIAFSGSDESDTTQRALRAGADWYFAKSLESPLDRDSEDYFRKLHSLVSGCPTNNAPMRVFWRRFSALEESLRRLGARSGSQTDSCCDFFRLAYFFSMEHKVLPDQRRSLDVRHEVLFGHPEYAAQPAMSAAIRLLIEKINGIETDQAVEFYSECCEAFRRLKLPFKTWGRVYAPWGALQRARHNRRVLTKNKFWLAIESFLSIADRATSGMRFGIRETRPLHGFAKTLPAVGYNEVEEGIVNDIPARARKAWQDIGSPRLELPETSYLIVDAEGRNWAQVLHEISGRHFRVYIPPSPKEWYEPLRQRLRSGPAVVWLGMKSLGPDSTKFIRALKSEFFSVPLLVATDTSDSVAVQRAFRNGASAYVSTSALAKGSREHLITLFDELRRLGELASVPSVHALWRNIVEIRSKAASSDNEQLFRDCADMLAIAHFCYHQDDNPSEEWRFHVLVPSSARSAMASWMVGRVAESILEAAAQRLPRSQRSQMIAVVQARNSALYGRDGAASLKKCLKIVCDALKSL